MESNKYLDKIFKFIIDETIFDYENKRIYLPSIESYLPIVVTPNEYSLLDYLYPTKVNKLTSYNPLSNLGKDHFGLTQKEIDYIWDRYQTEITNELIKNKHLLGH
jgi:hypothetical protein